MIPHTRIPFYGILDWIGSFSTGIFGENNISKCQLLKCLDFILIFDSFEDFSTRRIHGIFTYIYHRNPLNVVYIYHTWILWEWHFSNEFKKIQRISSSISLKPVTKQHQNPGCKLQQSFFMLSKMNQKYQQQKKKHIKPSPLPVLAFQKKSHEKTHPAPLDLKMSGRWSPRWSWHSPRHGAWWAVQSCGKWCSSPPHNGSTLKHDILTFTWRMKDSLWYKWPGCHPNF